MEQVTLSDAKRPDDVTDEQLRRLYALLRLGQDQRRQAA